MADDVVQDVFVAVIEDASGYRANRSGVLPWLLGIARNHVRRWRSQRPVQPLPGDETPAGRDLAVRPDPLADISMQRNTTALRRALLELPVRYRETIVLCDLQELSYVDAAACARLRRRHRAIAAAPGPRAAGQAPLRRGRRTDMSNAGDEINCMSCHQIEPHIVDLARGVTSDQDARLARHVLGCPSCAGRLEQERAMSAALRGSHTI